MCSLQHFAWMGSNVTELNIPCEAFGRSFYRDDEAAAAALRSVLCCPVALPALTSLESTMSYVVNVPLTT